MRDNIMYVNIVLRIEHVAWFAIPIPCTRGEVHTHVAGIPPR